MIDDEFVTLVEGSTPLPFRRIIEVPVPAGSGSASILLSLWEGINEIKVEAPVKKVKSSGGFFSRASKDEEEEEDEEEDTRTAVVTPKSALADLVVNVENKVVGKKSVPKVKITLIVDAAGKGSVEAGQEGAEAVKKSF